MNTFKILLNKNKILGKIFSECNIYLDSKEKTTRKSFG